MKRKARNTTYKCPVLQCAQSTCMFKKRTQLIEHMNNSELCSPFVKQCQGCGDQFEADYNLKYHLRSKTRCQNITDEAGRSATIDPKLFQQLKTSSADGMPGRSVYVSKICAPTKEHEPVVVQITVNTRMESAMDQSHRSSFIANRSNHYTNEFSGQSAFRSSSMPAQSFTTSGLRDSHIFQDDNDTDDWNESSSQYIDDSCQEENSCENSCQDLHQLMHNQGGNSTSRSNAGAPTNGDDANEENDESTYADYLPRIEEVNRLRNNLDLGPQEKCLIDLFLTLRVTGASMKTFDQMIKWYNKWTTESNKLTLSRHTFLKRMEVLVHGRSSQPKPNIESIVMTSNTRTSMTVNSFEEMIVQMVTDKALFHPDNILLNPDNPFEVADSTVYGDVNSGSWHKESTAKYCDETKKEILLPLTFFIDGMKLDNYGKLEVEGVFCTCLWYKRNVRRRNAAWFILGFLEDLRRMKTPDDFIKNKKVKDYHDMLEAIFSGIELIHKKGGMKIMLDFGNGKVHKVIAKPAIQFIIGDCKGHDLLCGRKGGHSIATPGLCRDCDIKTVDAGNPDVPCTFRTVASMLGKDKAYMDSISFNHLKRNCFDTLPFGASIHGIYGGTPVEILHSILLGLCVALSSSLDTKFTETFHTSLDCWTARIYQMYKHQSEKDVHRLSAFKDKLINPGSLTGKEKLSRIFAVYLILMQSEFVRDTVEHTPYRYYKMQNPEDKTEEKVAIDRHYLRNVLTCLEQTLCFHEWLKKEEFRKEEIDRQDIGIQSPAEVAIRSLQKLLTLHMPLKGNVGWNTTKFHQLWHYIEYIIRNGSPLNWDGSDGERIGKTFKDLALQTSRHGATMNHGIAQRSYEVNTILRAASIHIMKTKEIDLWALYPDKDLLPFDITANSKLWSEKEKRKQKRHQIRGTSFSIIRNNNNTLIDNDEMSGNDSETEKLVDEITVQWNTKKGATPGLSFSRNILVALYHRLFLQNANLGGRLSDDCDTIIGRCEYVDEDGNLYRAHPSYKQTGEWNDWAFFQWTGYENLIPAKILMMFELEDEFIVQEEDTEQNVVGMESHLVGGTWCIVRAADGTVNLDQQLDDEHFDSCIATRIRMEKELRIIPMTCINSPALVIENLPSLLINGRKEWDNTAMVVCPRSEWASHFVNTT